MLRRFSPLAVLFLSLIAAPSLFANSAKTSVTFKYEPAEPRIVNGRSHLEHKFWACVDEVKVVFDEGVRYVSMQGSVVAQSDYRTDRALTLHHVSQDLRTFIFKAAGNPICAAHLPYTNVTVKKGVVFSNGGRLTADLTTKLHFPPGRDNRPQSLRTLEKEIEASREAETEESVAFTAKRVCPGGSTKPCLANLLPTARVSHSSLNATFLKFKAWQQQESKAPYYRHTGLFLMPISDTIMVPRGSTNRDRHYGKADVISVTRASAKFTSLLLPQLKEIGIADITTDAGETPHTTWPDGTRQYLHPEGSHQGDDVDIGYISLGEGNDRQADIDLEANFWLLYSVLQSTGVDLVYTAYRRQFVDYAQAAFRKGYINEIAAARFSSARLIQDNNLRHDTHMHVKVANHDNGRQSIKFTPQNDVYNCFLGLKIGRVASDKNFCLGN